MQQQRPGTAKHTQFFKKEYIKKYRLFVFSVFSVVQASQSNLKHFHHPQKEHDLLKALSLNKLWEIEDREAWRAAVHRVARSWTRLGN